MSSPYKGQTGISGNTTNISLWFSENIVSGNGSAITLRRTDTTTTSSPNIWTFSTGSSAVVISGHRLDILLSLGILNPHTGGTYRIEFPAGVVKDTTSAE